MSIILRWIPVEEANISKFKIYRSIIGFIIPDQLQYSLSGLNLQLRINNTTIQNVFFNRTYTQQELVDHLNQSIIGATVFKGDKIILRSNLRRSPGFVEIVGGTALSVLGLSPKTISEKSDTIFLDEVIYPETTFEDIDGVLEDYYGLSTVDSLNNESLISALRQAINFSGPVCVIEGCITDLQGARKSDIKVTARITTPPTGLEHTSILQKEVYTLTGEDGRFSLPLLQGVGVIFEINDTRVSDTITVPNVPYVFFDSLEIDYGYIFEDKI